MNEKDERYSYTYACDYLRAVNPEISRSEMSQIRHMIADVLKMEDKELAEKLANAYLSVEAQVYVFKDDKERIEVPKNSVAFKINTIAGIKMATWLEPKK